MGVIRCGQSNKIFSVGNRKGIWKWVRGKSGSLFLLGGYHKWAWEVE